MAKCVECGKEFHACGSCGIMDWEYQICSYGDCLDNYVKKSTPIQSILDKIEAALSEAELAFIREAFLHEDLNKDVLRFYLIGIGKK